MEENTNLSTPIDDGSDLFFEAEETTADTSETDAGTEAEPEAEEAVETEKPAEQAGKLKVKYNGEEKEITYDEAVILAQKGMNYDKAIERERAATNKVNSILEHYAAHNNMSVDEYIDYLDQQRDVMVVQQELAKVREQYPELDDNAAKEIASLRAKESRGKIEQAIASKQKAEQEAAQKPWLDFAKRYPEYKDVSKIPSAVFDKVGEGLSPIEAMLEHERDELKAKLEAAEKNKTNKQKSIGSVTSTASEKEADAFLMGLEM